MSKRKRGERVTDIEVKLITNSDCERTLGMVLAVLIGKMQTASPSDAAMLSKEIAYWYKEMWG